MIYNGNTLLNAIKIPYFEVVLEELFFVPPKSLFPDYNRPLTISELAESAGMTVEVAIKKIESVESWCKECLLTQKQMFELKLNKGTEITYLDVSIDGREEPIPYAKESMHLHSCYFPKVLIMLRNAAFILVGSNESERSFSATMYLRSLGIHNVRCHLEKT